MPEIIKAAAEKINKDPMESMSFEDLVKETGGQIPVEEPKQTPLDIPAEQLLQNAQSPEDKSLLEKIFQNAAPNFAAGVSPSPGSVGAEISSPNAQEQPQIAKGAAQGVVGIAQGAVNLGVSTANLASSIAAKMGLTEDDVTKNFAKVEWQTKLQSPNDNVGTRLVSSVVQYMAPGMAAAKALNLGLKGTAAANVAVDFALMDPNQDRLANLVTDVAPELRDVVLIGNALKYLEHKDGEGDWEGRFKNALESLAVNSIPILPEFGQYIVNQNKVRAIAGAVSGKVSDIGEAFAKKAAGNIIPGMGSKAPATAEAAKPVLSVVKEGAQEIPKAAPQAAKAAVSVFDMETPVAKKLLDISKLELDKIAPRTTDVEVTQKAMNILADDKQIIATLDKVLSGTGVNAEEGQALRMLVSGVTNDVIGTLATAKDGDIESLSKMLDALSTISGASTASEAAGRIQGQALRARQITNAMGISLDEFNNLIAGEAKERLLRDKIRLAGGKEELQNLANNLHTHINGLDDLDKLDALEKIASEGSIPKIARTLNHLMINNMLGVKSAVGAFFSNAQTNVFNYLDTRMAKFLGDISQRAPGLYRKWMNGAGANLPENFKARPLGTEGLQAYTRGYMLGVAELMQKIGASSKADDLAKAYGFTNFDDVMKFADKNWKPNKFGFVTDNPFSKVALNITPDDNAYWQTIGTVAEKFGMVSGATTKLIGGADMVFSPLNYRPKLAELVHTRLQAYMTDGMTPTELNNLKRVLRLPELKTAAGPSAQRTILDKEMYDQAFTKLMANPFIEDHRVAQEHARHLVMAAELPDSNIWKILDENPLLKAVFPFTRVTYNAARWALEHSPVAIIPGATSRYSPIRHIAGKVAAELASGNQVTRDMAMAKIVNGSIFMGTIASLASLGYVTGPGSSNYRVNAALKDSGREYIPMAIGGLSIEKMDNLRPLAEFGFIMSNLRRDLSDERYQDVALNVSAALGGLLTSKQLVDNTADFTAMVSSVYNREDKAGEAVMKFAANFGGRFSPALGREAAIAVEQIANVKAGGKPQAFSRDANVSGEDYQGFIGAIKELNARLLNQFKADMPWYNQDLPVYRNILGEPQLVPQAMFRDELSAVAPFVSSRGEESDIMSKLALLANESERFGPLASEALKLNIAKPGRVVRIPGESTMSDNTKVYLGGNNAVPFEMTPKQYDKYMEYFGNLHEGADGPTLREELESVLGDNAPQWQALLEGGRTDKQYKAIFSSIHRVFTDAGIRAKALMMQNEDDFREAYSKKVEDFESETKDLLPKEAVNMLGR